jgi:hypothetical protein
MLFHKILLSSIFTAPKYLSPIPLVYAVDRCQRDSIMGHSPLEATANLRSTTHNTIDQVLMNVVKRMKWQEQTLTNNALLFIFPIALL